MTDDRTAEQLARAYLAAQKENDRAREDALFRAFVARQAEEMAQREIRRRAAA